MRPRPRRLKERFKPNSLPREEGRLRRQPQADGDAGEVTPAEMFIGAATTPALRASPPHEEGNGDATRFLDFESTEIPAPMVAVAKQPTIPTNQIPRYSSSVFPGAEFSAMPK